MSEAFARYHVAPLQKVVAEPITDPAELAAIDAGRKQTQEASGDVTRWASARNGDLSSFTAPFLTRWRESSPEERERLLARLLGEMTEVEQSDLLVEVLARLSPITLQRLNDQETGAA